MTFELWQTILMGIAGILTVVGSFYAARYTARSAVKVKELDVDGKAFERAEKIYTTSLDRLESEFNTYRTNSTNDISNLKERSKEQDEEIRILSTAVEKVNGAFQLAVAFIEEILLWDGTPGTRPRIPELLKEHLSPSLLARHNTAADNAADASERS